MAVTIPIALAPLLALLAAGAPVPILVTAAPAAEILGYGRRALRWRGDRRAERTTGAGRALRPATPGRARTRPLIPNSVAIPRTATATLYREPCRITCQATAEPEPVIAHTGLPNSFSLQRDTGLLLTSTAPLANSTEPGHTSRGLLA